jgi:Protein of unknown function (DUF3443)
MKKIFKLILVGIVAGSLAACGGGGSSSSNSGTASPSNSNPGTQSGSVPSTPPPQSSTANTVPVVFPPQVMINGARVSMLNQPEVSVTICQPGTSNCATIANILVDTASSGLRIFKPAIPSSLAFPVQSNPASGNSVGECMKFLASYAWGYDSLADVKMAGETASNIPIQIVDDSLANTPSDCSEWGIDEQSTYNQGLPFNGILGVRSSQTDGASIYDCTGSTCTTLTSSTLTGAANVVRNFSNDNNGVILTLPAIPDQGASAVTGLLTFGINTQANNQTSGVTMIPAIDIGLTGSFNGESIPVAFDSGSAENALSDVPLPACLDSASLYCPTTTTTEALTIQSNSGTGGTLSVPFQVSNGDTYYLHNAANPIAIPNVAAINTPHQELYFGIPFLLGHQLFQQYPMYNATTDMMGLQSTPAGMPGLSFTAASGA